MKRLSYDADWARVNVADVVPHAGVMLLLDRLEHVDTESLTARVVVRDDGIYSERDGTVRTAVVVEYMAQAVAAFAGVRSLSRGEKVRLGLLLGVRGYRSGIARLHCGDSLEVRVRSVVESQDGLGVFDCETSRGTERVTATLTVISVDSLPTT